MNKFSLQIVKNKGFTLVEMVIVMGIIGIMIMAASPLFQASMTNNRLYSEASQTVTILTMARTEAIKRNDFISVCPTNDGATCMAAGTDFQTGTIVFLNSNRTGLSVATQIIKVFDKWSQLDKGKLSSGNSLTFGGDGSSSTNNNILICKATYPSFLIDLSASGKIKVSNNAGDGGC